MGTEAGRPDCAAIIISSLQATSERHEDHRRQGGQGARGTCERLWILTLTDTQGCGELIWQERGWMGLRQENSDCQGVFRNISRAETSLLSDVHSPRLETQRESFAHRRQKTDPGALESH